MTNTTESHPNAIPEWATHALATWRDNLPESAGPDYASMIGQSRAVVAYLPDDHGTDLSVVDVVTGDELGRWNTHDFAYADAWADAMGHMATWVDGPRWGHQTDIGMEYVLAPDGSCRCYGSPGPADRGFVVHRGGGGPVGTRASHIATTATFADAWAIVTAHVTASLRYEAS